MLIFGISQLFLFIYTNTTITYDWSDEIQLGYKIYSVFIGVMLILNFILYDRKHFTKFNIIEYVGTIAISILTFFGVISIYFWNLFFIAILFVYVCRQDKKIQVNENKTINFIFYKFLLLGISVSFFITVILSLILVVINESNWDSQLKKLYGEIKELNDSDNSELYIPVSNNSKYGFVNQNAEEKISCEYDNVSSFATIEIDGEKYYFALALEDDKIYIISKSNSKIDLSNNIYLYSIKKYYFRHNKDYYDTEPSSIFRILMYFIKDGTKIEYDSIKNISLGFNSTNLSKGEKAKLYAYFKNYTLALEPLNTFNDITRSYTNYDEEYEKEYKDRIFRVTLIKENKETTDIVYLPDYYVNSNNLEYSGDGIVIFRSLDQKNYGWYNSYGNKIELPENYDVSSIYSKGNKNICVTVKNNFKNSKDNGDLYDYLYDENGNILLEGITIEKLNENLYVVQKDNRYYIFNTTLNKIIKEYDKMDLMFVL